MRAWLVTEGSEQTLKFPLAAHNTIGRHPDTSIHVNHLGVSIWHCQIDRDAQGRYVVRDSKSTNGTWVNGKEVGEAVLAHGDEIALATLRFRFLIEQEEAASTRVQFVPAFAARIKNHVDSGEVFLPANQLGDQATLRADYEKLRAAHALSTIASVGKPLDELLQRVIDETFRVLRADRAVILFWDPASAGFQPRFERQKGDEPICLSTNVLETVRKERRGVLVEDAAVDRLNTLVSRGVRSAMCVPLEYQGELLGAMHVDSSASTGAFSVRDLELLSTIAVQASVAIQNHRLALRLESEAATRSQLERLLSPNVVEELLRGNLKLDLTGTVRDVSLLFADIRGFTAMSERMPPGDVFAMLNEYFERMTEVLFRYGGTLDKYVGDELIGLFGAPVALPDAPLRAVRCAFDMLRALEGFNRSLAGSGRDGLRIGIGINTGPVMVGTIGSRRTLQYTAIGDAMNVTARLCSHAEPGEILISESTYALCRAHVIAEAREPLRVKGKEQALPVRVARQVRETAPLQSPFPTVY